jgi:hypothetical protein
MRPRAGSIFRATSVALESVGPKTHRRARPLGCESQRIGSSCPACLPPDRGRRASTRTNQFSRNDPSTAGLSTGLWKTCASGVVALWLPGRLSRVARRRVLASELPP